MKTDTLNFKPCFGFVDNGNMRNRNIVLGIYGCYRALKKTDEHI